MAEKKTRFGFGSKNGIQSAKDLGILNEYDFLCLDNGEVGWIDAENNTVINTPRTQNEITTNGSKVFDIDAFQSGLTMDELLNNLIQHSIYSIEIGQRPSVGMRENVLYIDNYVGYIWVNNKWKEIFKNNNDSITDHTNKISELSKKLNDKANVNNPNFTGTAMLNSKEIAIKEYVDALVAAAKAETPIVIDEHHPFPSTEYKAGQKYIVALSGIYFGQKCEIGDLILIIKDYSSSHSDSDAIILQSNIDGAVTGPDSSIDGEIIIFNGATGKVIKSSNINISTLNEIIAKAHEHANMEKINTYDKTQTELLSSALAEAKNYIDKALTIVEF